MIRVFTELIKIEKMSLTVQQLTDIMLKTFASSKGDYCRKCRASGMRKLTGYHRKITDYLNGKPIDYVLSTQRFVCPVCGSTHAFLISLVIPYGRHSLTLVLRALLDLYTRDGTIEQICARYQIINVRLSHLKSCVIFFQYCNVSLTVPVTRYQNFPIMPKMRIHLIWMIFFPGPNEFRRIV